MKTENKLLECDVAKLNNMRGCILGQAEKDQNTDQLALLDKIILAKGGELRSFAKKLPTHTVPKRTSISESEVDPKILEEVKLAEFYAYKVTDSMKRGIEFSLTFAELKCIKSRKTCAYTGVRFEHTKDPRTTPTLERIDGEKGYVKGNVVLVSKSANQLKNDLVEDITSGRYLPADQMKMFIKTALKAYL